MEVFIEIFKIVLYSIISFFYLLLFILFILDLFCVISPASKLLMNLKVNLFSELALGIQKRGYTSIKNNILDFLKNDIKLKILIVVAICYLGLNGTIMEFFTSFIR